VHHPSDGAGTDDPAAADAMTVAAGAAARAGVRIEEVHDHRTATAVAQLFDRVWGREPGVASILAPEAVTALAHAGSQVSAAFDGERLVGATAAFLGTDGDRVWSHSHVTGVDAGVTGRGIGAALKWHQRAWCLQRNIAEVRWTFDPTIRRNAVLNLVVLGAQAVGFVEDVYGEMPDARNVGLPTDRLTVRWTLTAPRVLAAATGRAAEPDLAGLRRAGAETALEVGPDEAPVVTRTAARRRLVRVPADIEAIRARDRDLAAAWAQALRDTLGALVGAGWRVTGATRDGWYVLSAGDGVTELGDLS
jgi:predicted GNAT superfamily acetyltransferase